MKACKVEVRVYVWVCLERHLGYSRHSADTTLRWGSKICRCRGRDELQSPRPDLEYDTGSSQPERMEWAGGLIRIFSSRLPARSVIGTACHPGMHLESWSHLSYTKGSWNWVKPHRNAGGDRPEKDFARERMIYSEWEELQYLILAIPTSRICPRNPICLKPPSLGHLEQELYFTEIWLVIIVNICGDNMLCQSFYMKWLF